MGEELIGTMIGTAAQVSNDIIGMITQKSRERRAMANQRSLMDYQTQNQMKLNEQGQKIQQETWEATNYPAQVQQLIKAGLNPALLYGKGGAGGVTGSQGGGSASGGSAPSIQPYLGINALDGAAKIAEIGLTKALEKKANAEADKTAGVDTKLAETTIGKLIAETTNEEIKGRLMQVQADIMDIEKAWKPKILENEVESQLQNIKKLVYENNITVETAPAIIEEIRQKAIGQALVNALTAANVKVSTEEAEAIRQTVKQKWDELGLRTRETNQKDAQIIIETFKADLQAKYPNFWNLLGRISNDAYISVKNIESILSGGTWETPWVQHRDSTYQK